MYRVPLGEVLDPHLVEKPVADDPALRWFYLEMPLNAGFDGFKHDIDNHDLPQKRDLLYFSYSSWEAARQASVVFQRAARICRTTTGAVRNGDTPQLRLAVLPTGN